MSDNMKIENISITERVLSNKDHYQRYLKLLKQLKVGQSFKVDHVPQQYRMAAFVAKHWLGKVITIRKEKDGYRVGCTGRYIDI